MKYFTPICKLPLSERDRKEFNYKYPKLAELADFFRISEREIAKQASALFGMPGKGRFHDSRIDATAVYLAFKKALEGGLVKTGQDLTDAFVLKSSIDVDKIDLML